MSSSRKPLELPPQLGPCVELTPLGQGSMGSVYRARHTRLGRDVAIKVIDPRLGAQDPVALKRFLREAELLAKLRDPHVVGFVEAGQEGRFAYAIMELIAGQSLKRLVSLEPQRRFDAPTTAWYLTQVARGLSAVHAAGIVHRDLKPENVIVDASGTAKIADFGLARARDSQTLTMFDEVVGTPEYMAPEAITRRDVDGRADLYALGISAYELLSGDTPFHEGGVLAVVRAQVEQEAPPLQALRPDLPPALCALVHRLLAKDPGQRLPDAGSVAAALAPFAAHEPPHRPTPDVRPEGTRMPTWEELALVQLLLRHQVYPLDSLLDGLLAWRQGGGVAPFAVYLNQRAGLPLELARQSLGLARRQVVELRNRIARAQLAGLGHDLDPAAEPPSGRQLTAWLVEQGRLVGDEAQEVERRINRTLQAAAQKAVREVCQARQLAPAGLTELEGQLAPDDYRALLRAVLARLVSQL